MAKNSADKKKRRARRQQKKRHGSNVVPLFGAPTPHSLDAEFRSWASAEIYPDDPASANGMADYALTALDGIAQVRPGFDRTAWTGGDIDAMADYVEFFKNNPSTSPELAVSIAYALHAFHGFLMASKRWTGTDDAANDALLRLSEMVGLEYRTTSLPDVDEETERAALVATIPVRRLITLLEWLGAERPTTQSRWLKPNDARDLAESLGMDVPPGFRSMSTFYPLRHLWEHAQVLGLVDANTSRATPGRAAAVWSSGHTPIELLRQALAIWIRSGFPAEIEVEPDFGSSLMSVVVSGMTDSPNTIDEVVAWEPKLGLSTYTIDAIRRRLDTFIEEGWLAMVGDAYVVPAPLHQAVVSGLPLPGSGHAVAPNLDAVLTLHIRLKHVAPPVWREIDVDAAITLDELHDALQVIFDWENSHLHSFTAGGVVYMPDRALAVGDFDAGPEEDVTVGELLSAIGDSMVYEYDFGDGWEHLITVRAASPITDPDLPAAIVLDGEGMAPLEDVGGPPGWDDFVVAVNSPQHPRHKALRQWAGLRDGAALDATAFDVAAANRQLRRVMM